MGFFDSLLGPSGKASGLRGTGYKQIVSPLQDKRQAGLTNNFYDLLGSGGFQSGLQNLSSLAGGNQDAFEDLERPALKQFSELTGNLASRFSGMGSGARRSSGFQNATSQATSDFAQSLQSQRMGIQQQALQQLLGLSESLLNRPTFSSGFTQKQTPGWQSLLTGLGGLGGDIGGMLGGGFLAKKLFGL